MADTNWDICFICQVSTKDNVHSSKDGYKILAKSILEFYKKGKLGLHFHKISNTNLDLFSILTTDKAVYHHKCFLKYGDLKLKRFNKPSKEQKSTKDENRRKSTGLSDESRERFNLFCGWCSKKTLMLILSLQGHIRRQV